MAKQAGIKHPLRLFSHNFVFLLCKDKAIAYCLVNDVYLNPSSFVFVILRPLIS